MSSKARCQVGKEGRGVGLGELAMYLKGLLDGKKCLLSSAQIGKAIAKVVEARGQVRKEGRGVGLGKLTMYLKGLLDGKKCLLSSALDRKGDCQGC